MPRRYEVVEKSEAPKGALEQLASFIKGSYKGQAGIVYAFSRREASDVAAGLAERGVPAAFYHAGQEASERVGCSCKTAVSQNLLVIVRVVCGCKIPW